MATLFATQLIVIHVKIHLQTLFTDTQAKQAMYDHSARSSETKMNFSSWNDVPFADQNTLQQLRENFPRDSAEAKSFKKKVTRAFIVSAVVSCIVSIVGSIVAWKYYVKPKVLGW